MQIKRRGSTEFTRIDPRTDKEKLKEKRYLDLFYEGCHVETVAVVVGELSHRIDDGMVSVRCERSRRHENCVSFVLIGNLQAERFLECFCAVCNPTLVGETLLVEFGAEQTERIHRERSVGNRVELLLVVVGVVEHLLVLVSGDVFGAAECTRCGTENLTELGVRIPHLSERLLGVHDVVVVLFARLRVGTRLREVRVADLFVGAACAGIHALDVLSELVSRPANVHAVVTVLVLVHRVLDDRLNRNLDVVGERELAHFGCVEPLVELVKRTLGDSADVRLPTILVVR